LFWFAQGVPLALKHREGKDKGGEKVVGEGINSLRESTVMLGVLVPIAVIALIVVGIVS
jgi:hypothetical protein